MQIFDVVSNSMVTVSQTDFITPNAFVFLYQNLHFLTFRGNGIACWNFNGELVTKFEDHELWHQESNTDNICITEKNDVIISYCCSENKTTGEIVASINVSEILSGKSLAKISSASSIAHLESSGIDVNIESAKVNYALAGVTSLIYNEARNEVYTGNAYGNINRWAN